MPLRNGPVRDKDPLALISTHYTDDKTGSSVYSTQLNLR